MGQTNQGNQLVRIRRVRFMCGEGQHHTLSCGIVLENSGNSARIVERRGRAMRIHMQCYKCATSGFLGKFENHARAVTLYMMNCNLVTVHFELGSPPKKERGLGQGQDLHTSGIFSS